jgi:hypothetical protein
MIAMSIAAYLVASNPNAMDFWVGEWVLDSETPSADGMKRQEKFGKNVITKSLGDKVIEERFTSPGFNGQSWTVYNTKTQKFQQTWVDDAGAYLTFVGGPVGNEVVLEQQVPAKGMRMRFTEITKDRLIWLWESEKDGQWTLKWRMTYNRKK